LLQSLLLVLLLIGINFFLIHLAPGDPVYLLAGQSGDEKYYEFIRAKFGLDQPLTTQLWIYYKNVLRGDLGFSFHQQQPVAGVVFSRVPPTLLLMMTALIISSITGIFFGVNAAQRANTFVDRTMTLFSGLSYSIPSFCLGQIILLLFSLHLGLFPSQGMISANREASGIAQWLDILSHLVLPATTLAIMQSAMIARLTRTEMLKVLSEDYILAARAKGLTERLVLYRHGLRNAMLPIVTILGNDLGTMLSGAVLIETVFAWPGLGRLMLESISSRDYPVLMGLFLLVSIGVVLANLLTDIIYFRLDPRVSNG
jgi:peptide/nickel transport system permease protein